MSSDTFADPPQTRRRGLGTMEKAYGFDMSDGEGDFFGDTADHLVADVWNRPGLSDRDRRLLPIGLLAGTHQADVLGIQVPAAHARGELVSAEWVEPAEALRIGLVREISPPADLLPTSRRRAAFAQLLGGPANLEALAAFAEGREPGFTAVD